MCGIAGFIGSPPKGTPSERLKSMLDAQAYRGPDDWGGLLGGPDYDDHQEGKFEFSKADHRLGLGHRRLSIIDLSEKGRQPMPNHTHDLWLTFNGEVYNYLELKQQLAHYPYKTNTDSEVILAAYQAWGSDMLTKLEGMYALVIWDQKKQTLFCARDPFGIKPFYYRQQDDFFVFASEPHAINQEFVEAPSVNKSVAADFLLLGFTDHRPQTFFQEINQLPPGHYMEVATDLSQKKINRFWRPTPNSKQQDASPEWLYQQLKHSVMLHMRSDVPVGGCLSGGLDSGSILAAGKELLGADITNFNAITFGANDFSNDESELAQMTAQLCGVQWHHVQPQSEDLEEDLNKLVKHMGEPFTSLSVYAQHKVMAHAGALGLKVMLDGQGGDEMFLGYPRVANLVLSEYLKSFQILKTIREVQGFRRNASLSLVHQAGLNLFLRTPALVRKRNYQRVHTILSKAWLEHLDQEVVEDYFGDRDLQSLQIKELTRYVIPRLLRYEDRNSMCYSIEARVPLLSKHMAEAAFSLPFQKLVKEGWTKYLLRQALTDKLPQEVVWNRVKRGFDIPQKQWVSDLSAHLKQRIQEAQSLVPSDIMDISAVSSQIDQGKAHNPYIWRCISFILWLNNQRMSL